MHHAPVRADGSRRPCKRWQHVASDAHDGNGGPACASTEPFAAFDARAQCHKPRSRSFSNKWSKTCADSAPTLFVFSSLLEVPALCLLPSGVAHRRLEGARPKRSRSTTIPRKSARSWPQRGVARQTRRRRTARQLQLDRKYFMPPSSGFWLLEIHIIQHMSSVLRRGCWVHKICGTESFRCHSFLGSWPLEIHVAQRISSRVGGVRFTSFLVTNH